MSNSAHSVGGQSWKTFGKAAGSTALDAAREAGVGPQTLVDALKVGVAAVGVGLARARHQDDLVEARREKLDQAVVDLVGSEPVQAFTQNLQASAQVQELRERFDGTRVGEAFHAFGARVAHRAANRYSAALALQDLGLPANFTGPLNLRALYSDPSKRAAADKLLNLHFGWEADPLLGEGARGLVGAFPNPDLLEDKASMREYLMDPEENWNISVQLKGGQVVGGVNYNVFEDPKHGDKMVLEHVFVDASVRQQGNGREIVEGVINQAREANPGIQRVLIEVDEPKAMPADERQRDPMNPDHRQAFWGRMGFQKIDHGYIQPKLADDKQDVDWLSLGVLDLSHLAPGQPFRASEVPAQRSVIDSNVVRADVRDYWTSWVETAAGVQGYINQMFQGVPNAGVSFQLLPMTQDRGNAAA